MSDTQQSLFSNLSQINPELLNGTDASIAIVVSRENSSAQAYLDAIVKHLNKYQCNVEPHNIFAVNGIAQMPLITQALAESMLYDAILVLDLAKIHSSKLTLQATQHSTVLQALYNCELESGIALIKGIEIVSDNEYESTAFIEQTAKHYVAETLESMNAVSVIRAMGLINEEENLELNDGY